MALPLVSCMLRDVNDNKRATSLKLKVTVNFIGEA